MKKFYTVDICGRKEDLPVMPLPSCVNICFFNLHGNVELTEYCAEKLAERIAGYEAEVILTAESKGLLLAHCMARNLGHKFYAVARKSKKLYMQDGISADAKTITTGEIQHLYLSAHDVELLKAQAQQTPRSRHCAKKPAATSFAARLFSPKATQKTGATWNTSRRYRCCNAQLYNKIKKE